MGAKPPAAPVLPVVTCVPMAAAPGTTTKVMFSGEGLGKPAGLWTSFAAEATVRDDVSGGKVGYRLKVPAEGQVGIGAVRVVSSSGASSLLFFMIDDLPTQPRMAAKHSASEARAMPEAGAVEGACEALASDFYVIEGKRGRRVSIEVVANRLGSRLDPVIRLIGPDGREVGFCDDFPGIAPDCMLAHTFEADGKYVVEVRDVNYEGGAKYYYRMRVGDFPLVTCAFPVVGQRGTEQPQHFSFEGAAGARLDRSGIKIPQTARRVPIGLANPGGMGSGFASILGADAADFVAREPNHQINSAAGISLPVEISGRFSVAGQKDYYAFVGNRGDRVRVRGQSRSIGSACELEVAIIGADGRKVPEPKPPVEAKKPAADAPALPTFAEEEQVEAQIPADGEYYIVARNIGAGAGTGMVYRLVVEHGPDFALAADSDKVDVPAGGSARMKVSCVRKGFAGRIRLSLEDGTGWEAGDAFIEAGKMEGEIEIKGVDGAVDKSSINLRIVGTATINDAEREHFASTAAALQKVYPRMRFVPAELDGLIGVGMKP